MSFLSTLAFVLIVIAAMVILVFRDWRINAFALTVQYLSAFILIAQSWPIGMAVVKLIVGWMATAALALTCLRQKEPGGADESTTSLFFRGLAGLLAIIVVFIISPTLKADVFPQVDLIILQSGLMLCGLALMQLGTSADPYLTIISLLSLLSGFEVIHAALEISTLLTGLLAVVNLGLALVGVYFITKMDEKPESPDQEGENS